MYENQIMLVPTYPTVEDRQQICGVKVVPKEELSPVLGKRENETPSSDWTEPS
jgi:hypothetical protein